ncbi:MAG: orotate phosphoribosyltransferase [Rhodanobacteraceae bacterium]
MQDYQRKFLELCLARGVLRFGDFTLKSGRRSPYFFNLGQISSGQALARLGAAYARRLNDSGVPCDLLFGPAYKGIALAAATAIAMADDGYDMPWAYNRKEAKSHGEGGHLVGAPLAGSVVVVDDVITAGTATRQALELIRAHGARPAALLVALDRCEPGQRGGSTAAEEISADFNIPVLAIATVDDLLGLTADHDELRQHHRTLVDWRAAMARAAP